MDKSIVYYMYIYKVTNQNLANPCNIYLSNYTHVYFTQELNNRENLMEMCITEKCNTNGEPSPMNMA